MVIKSGEGLSMWQPSWKLSGAGTSMWFWIVKASTNFWDYGFVDPGGGWVKFWDECWVRGGTLRASFPRVAAVTVNPNAFVFELFPACFRDDWRLPMLVELRRGALVEYRRFVSFLRQLPDKTISEGPAAMVWPLTTSAMFSVKSFNSKLRLLKFPGDGDFPTRSIWITVVPLKIQCFMWLVFHNRISTLDVLQTRGFYLPNRCVLCSHNEESASHLFIHCPFTMQIWSRISLRLSIIGPLQNNISEILSGWKWLKCEPLFEALKNVILHSFCWFIWLERNDAIFRDTTVSASRVYFRTVVSGCSWLKVHARISQHDFELWMRQLTAT
ncbi:hypothetical protein LINPERHAP1_LOCUS15169 [Linum perenne]